MTFALYGDVCRVRSGELRDLISHGATHVKVALDFRVNGTTYRVARRMKKTGQGHDVHFVRVEGEQETPVCDTAGVVAVNKAIEEVLGLDFSAFTKAVLLPQGAFHEFLKGDASARRKILIDLLDLVRYVNAGGRARSQANTLSARLDEREKLIESEYGDATAEHLAAATAGAKTAKAAYKKLQAIEQGAKEQAVAARAGEALAEMAASAADALCELQTDVADYAKELAKTTKRLGEGRAAVRSAAQVVKLAEKALRNAEAAVVKVVESGGDEAAIALLQAAAASRTSESATVVDLERQLSELTAAVVSVETIHAAAIATAKEAELAQARMQKEAGAAEAELYRTTLLLEYAQASTEDESSRAQLAGALTARESANAAAEAAQIHLNHLRTLDIAVTLRVGLKTGDACPVCETTVATLPKIDRRVASTLRGALADAASADKRRLATEGEYAAAAIEYDAAVRKLAAAKAAIPKGSKALPVAEMEATRIAAEGAAAQAQERFEMAQRALTEAEKLAAATDAACRETKATAAGIEKEAKGAQQRLEKAEQVVLSAFSGKLPTDLEVVLSKRLADLREVRNAVTSAGEAMTGAQSASADAVSAEHESESWLADLARRFAVTQTKVETSVHSLERVSTAALPSLPTGSEDLDAQIEILASCCPDYIQAAREATKSGSAARDRALCALEGLLEPLELEIDGDLEQMLESIAERREEVHTSLVRAESTAKLVKEKIVKRAVFEKEIKDDTVRCARYKTLADELRQDHFVAFVLEESMGRLAALASVELLRISGDRYSLVAEKGGFDVFDHHNADERRSVTTLSGGETFLASLALALALAGSVRDLAGTAAAARLDAIFIDEGFGALDPETLEVVLDALERLREGERMVGVISHVDELAQRIPQGLVVSKKGSVSMVAPR